MSTVRAELDLLDASAGEAGTRMAIVSKTVTEERGAGIVKHRRVPLPSLEHIWLASCRNHLHRQRSGHRPTIAPPSSYRIEVWARPSRTNVESHQSPV